MTFLQIYNITRLINQNHLDSLLFFVQLGRKAQGKTAGRKLFQVGVAFVSVNATYLQTLTFLMRDFVNAGEGHAYQRFGKSGGAQYITNEFLVCFKYLKRCSFAVSRSQSRTKAVILPKCGK